ncbi:hypothetical protein BC938DRAFT_482647, partial [Jimgerdemannia flammicorona]
ISDFGLSKTFTSISRGSQLGRTLRYIPPERLSDQKLTHQELILCDIYAYGLIVLEVATDGKQLYGEMSNQAVIIAKIRAVAQPHYTSDLPYDTPRTFRDIVNQCLKCNPSDRPSLTLVQDSFKAYAGNTPPPPSLPRTVPKTLSPVPIKEGDNGGSTESNGGDKEEGDGRGREYVRVVYVSSRYKRVRQLRRRRLRSGATEVRPCSTEVAPGHGTLPRPVVIIVIFFFLPGTESGSDDHVTPPISYNKRRVICRPTLNSTEMIRVEVSSSILHRGLNHGKEGAKLRISDFGLSKTFTSISRGSQLGRTLRYIPPERLSRQKLTHQELILCDIYAYGLVVLEVVTDGKQLYGEMSNQTVIIAKFHEVDQPHYADGLPDDTPRTFQEIVNRCLKYNPSDRPSLTLVQDSFKAYTDNIPSPLILLRIMPETLSLVPINEGDDAEEGGDGGGRECIRLVHVYVSSRRKRVRQLRRRRRLRSGATEVRPCPTEVAPGHRTLPRPVVIIVIFFFFYPGLNAETTWTSDSHKCNVAHFV